MQDKYQLAINSMTISIRILGLAKNDLIYQLSYHQLPSRIKPYLAKSGFQHEFDISTDLYSYECHKI